jgi:hypothetical protein
MCVHVNMSDNILMCSPPPPDAGLIPNQMIALPMGPAPNPWGLVDTHQDRSNFLLCLATVCMYMLYRDNQSQNCY